MASYCLLMLSMAMELADDDPAYEDVASKFFEHFVAIVDAMNTFGGTGLVGRTGWILLRRHPCQRPAPAFARSLDGRADSAVGRRRCWKTKSCDRLPGFKKRLNWFLENRRDLSRHITYCEHRLAKEAAADSCWPFRRASGWNECCDTCSTRTNSFRRMAFAPCRGFTTIILAACTRNSANSA